MDVPADEDSCRHRWVEMASAEGEQYTNVHFTVCLFAFLFVWLFMWLFVCLFVCLCVCVGWFVCLFVCLFLFDSLQFKTDGIIS